MIFLLSGEGSRDDSVRADPPDGGLTLGVGEYFPANRQTLGLRRLLML